FAPGDALCRPHYTLESLAIEGGEIAVPGSDTGRQDAVDCASVKVCGALESKREQFRRYLEEAGVLDSLTSVLVALYEEAEKPNNALDFLKQHLGVAGQESADTVALQQELRDMRQRWELLAEENKGLKNRVGLPMIIFH
uniref:MYC binding protein n=1 Tax=Hucho hucho TaxID=62062 RepID=A0A4W5MPU5_9TELE